MNVSGLDDQMLNWQACILINHMVRISQNKKSLQGGVSKYKNISGWLIKGH